MWRSRRSANRSTYPTLACEHDARDGNVFMCEYQPPCTVPCSGGPWAAEEEDAIEYTPGVVGLSRRRTRACELAALGLGGFPETTAARELPSRRPAERGESRDVASEYDVRGEAARMHVRAWMARSHARTLYGSKQVHTGDICSFLFTYSLLMKTIADICSWSSLRPSRNKTLIRCKRERL